MEQAIQRGQLRCESSLAQSVYETLLESIVKGNLCPGSVVSELALARRLDVSRTPVHDAVRQLAKDGLVEQQAGHRAVVTRLTPDEVFDLYEMRKLLEGEAARRAATRLDRQECLRLREMANRLANDGPDDAWLEPWNVFDETFHEAIAQASGSPRLYQDIVRYRLLHRTLSRLGCNPECLPQALAEHLQILEAIERRDPEAAARAMVAHLHEWQAYFVRQLQREVKRN